MDKIWLIIKREYSVRVRKKSFIIMTIVTPILLGLLIFAPSYLSSISSDFEQEERKNIAILEKDSYFSDRLMNSDHLNFTQIPESEKEIIKDNFDESSFHAIVEIINKNIINIISEKQISKITLREIKSKIYEINEKQNYKDANIDIQLLKTLSPQISFNNINSRSCKEINWFYSTFYLCALYSVCYFWTLFSWCFKTRRCQLGWFCKSYLYN